MHLFTDQLLLTLLIVIAVARYIHCIKDHHCKFSTGATCTTCANMQEIAEFLHRVTHSKGSDR